MANENFLLGFGERLTERVPYPPMQSDKKHPYSLNEARDRLLPRMEETIGRLDALPGSACPHNESVAVLTLHPAYLAKTYYPGKLLASAGLKPVGSKASSVKPKKWTKKGKPKESTTVELFIAGDRRDFANWIKSVKNYKEGARVAEEFTRIEDLRVFDAGERIVSSTKDWPEDVLLETVIHASAFHEDDYISSSFEKYVYEIGGVVEIDRKLHAGGLCFVPVRTKRRYIRQIEKFSFLRVIRKMPSLRVFQPILRNIPDKKQIKFKLPKAGAIDPSIKVAVFDGGTHNLKKLSPWVNRYGRKGLGRPVVEYQDHGSAVTSALLFGNLKDGETARIPYANVDHYRVLDEHTGKDEDLFDVLPRIMTVLYNGKYQYDFFNLSIGPNLPIDDNDVHAWTAILDQYLSTGNVLGTIAVGNDGDKDVLSGNARIQVPSDCVNAMGVGSCDTEKETNWRRADYSSFGPGRNPGLVKPDVVNFGGTESEPFYVIGDSKGRNALPVCGTSFASPDVLRKAIGIKAHFGNNLGQLAIKTLLIHRSYDGGNDRREVGWGRVANDIEQMVTCDPGIVTIVYQGELEPSSYVRAQIPLPSEKISSMVEITATFCFASNTDPQDPSNYTRSGLQITFRPHIGKQKNDKSMYPETKPFFGLSKLYPTETELRSDAHKWETVLHETKRMRGSSLKDPIFNIHHNARLGGASTTSSEKLPYALVITIKVPKEPDIYNKILNRYRTQLEVLQPVIEVPISIAP